MTKTAAGQEVLSTRALNRATLARQLLLRRARRPALDATEHLLGLQAQNPKPPYHALAARLADFDPDELSGLLERREVVRLPAMRSTIHLMSVEDALVLRPFSQPALDRELKMFRKGLDGVDLDRVVALAAERCTGAGMPLKVLGEELAQEWPDADRLALKIAARVLLPLVQTTPRGLWGQGGQVALATLRSWVGRDMAAVAEPDVDALVRRYLAAFGPASVKDMQTWAGVTRLRPAFERLRGELRTFRDPSGVELFDLPDAPRPGPDVPAPPRFLPEYDNVLLSHADRTRVVPPEFRGRTWQGNSAYCVFLVDGFLRGIWRVEEGTMVVEPFTPLSRAERDAVEAEAARVLEPAAPGGGVRIAQA
ncbi:winged helix DNA-binding domain-containing protein [Streptomyces sp. A7024]|uniref:Winged helix DNA-binding domain-containing protein n=1 Tax=Streptomyces coryli TaxID=1128680 RepID=A0A6G4TVJ1_9ACTN|nr:winged helix DNA-binding domain-containing protein [Streptomyces coryli]NGN63540.1 winged helix DNA-binding domain-containing protein [Streptomyces coryli]